MSNESILEIKDRKRVKVTGVISVLGFGEDYVTVETELGRLVIEGEKMKIESLSKEEGAVDISGIISSAYYSEIKKGEKLFSKFFK